MSKLSNSLLDNCRRGHNLVLLTKLKTAQERIAYAQKTLEHGCSRNLTSGRTNQLFQRGEDHYTSESFFKTNGDRYFYVDLYVNNDKLMLAPSSTLR